MNIPLSESVGSRSILGNPPLLWSVFLRRPSTWLVLAGLLAAWTVVVVGRILWNGQVFGLDYGLWYPDGFYYSYKAFMWGGFSSQAALSELSILYPAVDVPGKSGLLTVPSLYDSRFLYPFVSGPLTRVLGPWGLLVVPSLGLLIALLVPMVMLMRRGLVMPAIGVAALALTSTTLPRWTVANITDGLALALVTLMLPLFPWARTRVPMPHLMALAALGFLASLTRQVLPVIALMTLIPWALASLRYRSVGNVWARPMVASITGALAGFLLTFPRGVQALAPLAIDAGGAEALSPAQRLFGLPLDLARMVVVELGQLAILDRGLLLLMLLAAVVAAIRRDDPLVHLWLGVLLGSVVLTGWTGAGGVNFRMALALIPVSVLVASALLSALRGPSFERAKAPGA